MIEYLFLILALLVFFRMFCDLSVVNIAGTNITYITILIELIVAIIFLTIFLILYLKKRKNK